MKRAINALVAVLATVAMAVAGFMGAGTAFADEANTITINNSVAGHTYEAYQIFAGTISDKTLTDITWGANVTENGKAVLGDAADKAASLSDVTAAESFAKAVAQYLTQTPDATANAQTEGKYVLSVSKPGYYLIKDKDGSQQNTSEAYTAYILKVAGNVETNAKYDVPSLVKKVKENTKADDETAYGKAYNDVADYNIGDTVPFSVFGTIPTHRTDYPKYSYTFHDTYSAGLTFDVQSVKVYMVDSESEIEGTDVTESFKVTSDAANRTFTVSCSNINAISGIDSNKKFRVNYNATLNSNAKIGLPGNPNGAWLTFSNNPNADYSGETTPEGGESPKDYVIVFTYKLDSTKVDNANPDKKLAGAKFKLQNAAGKWATVDENGRISGWVDSKDAATEVVSDSTGKFGFTGLDAGEYKLTETEAPKGYKLPQNPFTFTITATTANGQNWDGSMEESSASTALTKLEVTSGDTTTEGEVNSGTVSLTVKNTSGSSLPETGGMGTIVLYAAGAVLVIAAGVYFGLKKKNAR